MNASALLYGPATTVRSSNLVAATKAWGRRNPQRYAEAVLMYAVRELEDVAARLLEAEGGTADPDNYQSFFEVEKDGSVCVTITIDAAQEQHGARRLLEPWELLQSPWVDQVSLNRSR